MDIGCLFNQTSTLINTFRDINYAKGPSRRTYSTCVDGVFAETADTSNAAV